MPGSRGDRRGDKVHKVRGFWLEVLDPWYKERELKGRHSPGSWEQDTHITKKKA